MPIVSRPESATIRRSSALRSASISIGFAARVNGAISIPSYPSPFKVAQTSAKSLPSNSSLHIPKRIIVTFSRECYRKSSASGLRRHVNYLGPSTPPLAADTNPRGRPRRNRTSAKSDLGPH